jgi:hypothetical protein
MGRAAQGVRLITLDEGDGLVSVANVSEEEPEVLHVAPPTVDTPVPEAAEDGDANGDAETAENGDGAEPAPGEPAEAGENGTQEEEEEKT